MTDLDVLVDKYSEIYKGAIPLPIDPFYKDDYNSIRRLKTIVISSILSKYSPFIELTPAAQIDILIHIENSCANETIRKARDSNIRCVWDNTQFTDIYHTVCYNISSSLDQGSISLIDRIISKDININNIANLSCKDLLPEKYEFITNKTNKRINIEQTTKYTKMYFCKKCKNNKTSVERVQARSGDEGSSFHITCLFCGTKWIK